MIAAATGLMAAALLWSQTRATGEIRSADAAPARTVRVGGLEVTIGAEAAGPPGVRTFELELEPVTASAQARLKGRSAKLRLSVRCEPSVFRAENFRVYAGPHGSGAEEAVALPDEWLRGNEAATLRSSRRRCARRTRAQDPPARRRRHRRSAFSLGAFRAGLRRRWRESGWWRGWGDLRSPALRSMRAAPRTPPSIG